MKPVKYIIFLFIIVMPFKMSAQSLADRELKKYKQLYKTTVGLPKEDDYDVKYVKFDLKPCDTSSNSIQKVSTTAQVVAENMNDYVFELSHYVMLDSVLFNGKSLSFVNDSDTRIIHLPVSLTKGDLFTIVVFYKSPLILNYSDKLGRFTMSQNDGAYTWWPCKQSLTDKIDSVDMIVTVPDTFDVTSNGLLINITKNSGYATYTWHEHYPIDYYLISLAEGNFEKHFHHIYLDKLEDSLLITNYVEKTTDTVFNMLVNNSLDTMDLVANYFSNLYGVFPFYKEKCGYTCMYSDLGESIEHQTLITMSYYGMDVFPHELAHQWFGDNVTYARWGDLWLNEGFASYSEYLYEGYFHDRAAANKRMQAFQNAAKVYNFSTYISDSNNFLGNYYLGNIVYDKGASIVHMLRGWVNNDGKFFKILQDYQRQYSFSTATSEDLISVFSKEFGQDMTVFLDEWIYGKGYPIYSPSWNQASNVVFIKIIQNPAFKASTQLYTMPIDIKLYSSEGDTTVRVFNTDSIQVFQVLCDRKIDSISFDPDEWILCNKNVPFKDTTINTLPVDVIVYPNPVPDVFYLKYKQLIDPTIMLYDMAGRKLMEQKILLHTGIEMVDVHQLPRGIYIYKLYDSGTKKAEGKLFKE